MKISFINQEGQEQYFTVPHIELHSQYSMTEPIPQFDPETGEQLQDETPREEKMVGSIQQLQDVTLEQYDQISSLILSPNLKYVAIYDNEELVFLVKKDMIKRHAINLIGGGYLYQCEFEYTLAQWDAQLEEFETQEAGV